MLSRIVLAFAVVALIVPMARAPTAQGATPAQIEEAITDGLAWLAAQQKADGHFESTDHTIGRPIAATCLALLKFEQRALDLGFSSPFDPGYQYHQQVGDGLNYAFGQMTVAGNFVHVQGQVYETGICMMAVAASAEPNRASPVAGKTFKQVLQGMMAWMEDAQNDGIHPNECDLGGWTYIPNLAGQSDNSNSGYATLGIGFAGRMGLSPAAATLTKLSTFIDNIRDPASGGSAYASCPPNNAVMLNILKTGNLLYEMKLVGRLLSDPTVQAAKGYIETNWNASYDVGWQFGPGQGYYQAMFTMMKGLESYGIDTLGLGIGSWFDKVSTYIVGEQQGPGYWTGTGAGSHDWVLETSWALLTLEKVIPAPPIPTSTPRPGVGGAVNLPPAAVAAESGAPAEGSGWGTATYAALAGSAIAVAAAAWYARRRWMR